MKPNEVKPIYGEVGSSCDVASNVLDYNITVNEFELLSRH